LSSAGRAGDRARRRYGHSRAEGAGVVLLDNEADVLAATADSIRATGARVEAVAGDVSRRDDVRKASSGSAISTPPSGRRHRGLPPFPGCD